MAHDIPLPCNAEACSPNGVCCGLDVGKYYCASHCFCANRTTSPGSNHSAPGIWGPGCWCDPGFHGVECSMEMSPTVWLAVILVVGTLLVLFIAWGFRCSDDGDTTVDWDPDGAPGRRGRAPLLREAADRAAAAARPPTEIPSSTDASCTVAKAAFASDEVRERAREIVASGNAQLARHPLYKDTGSSQPLDVYFGVRHVRFRAQEERGLELLRGLALDRTAPHFQRITRGALARGYVRQLRELCADLREAPPDSLLGCEELLEEYNERMGRWLPLFPNSTP